jgi:hypothetical protein
MIDFAAVNRVALSALPILLRRWLPDGQRRGHEWIARNPTRVDRHPGSFKINLQTGHWADFAADARGADPVSLFAYLRGIGQGKSARELEQLLRIGR